LYDPKNQARKKYIWVWEICKKWRGEERSDSLPVVTVVTVEESPNFIPCYAKIRGISFRVTQRFIPCCAKTWKNASKIHEKRGFLNFAGSLYMARSL